MQVKAGFSAEFSAKLLESKDIAAVKSQVVTLFPMLLGEASEVLDGILRCRL